MATYAGLDRAYVSKLERGIFESPGFDAVFKLARALEVTLDELSSEMGFGTPVPTRVSKLAAAELPAIRRALQAVERVQDASRRDTLLKVLRRGPLEVIDLAGMFEQESSNRAASASNASANVS